MPWMVAVLTWDADKKNQRDGLTPRQVLAKNFVTYDPKIRELVVENRQRTWRESFLFGRYSFVAMLDNWREAFRARAVQQILTSAKRDPLVAPDVDVDRFKHMEDSSGFVVLPEDQRKKLRRGDMCRVLAGPFADRVGVYRGMGSRDREVALVKYMGRFVRVNVAAGSLAPA